MLFVLFKCIHMYKGKEKTNSIKKKQKPRYTIKKT